MNTISVSGSCVLYHLKRVHVFQYDRNYRRVFFPSKAERGNVGNLFYVDSHHDGISFRQLDLSDSNTTENLFHHSVHTLSSEIGLGQSDNWTWIWEGGWGLLGIFIGSCGSVCMYQEAFSRWIR